MSDKFSEAGMGLETPTRVTELLQLTADRLVEIAKVADPEHAEKARALLIGELGNLTTAAERGAEDFEASEALTAIAFVLAATSPEMTKDSQILFNRYRAISGYDDEWEVSVQSGYGSFPSMTIPLDIINPNLIQEVRVKLESSGAEFLHLYQEIHTQPVAYEHNWGKKLESNIRVYKAIGDFARLAPIERLIGVFYNAHTSDGKGSILQQVRLIKECREAAGKEGGVEELARKNIEIIKDAYDHGWYYLPDY